MRNRINDAKQDGPKKRARAVRRQADRPDRTRRRMRMRGPFDCDGALSARGDRGRIRVARRRGMPRLLLLLGLLPGSLALVYEAGVRGHPARRASRSRVPTASLSSWEMSAGGVAMQSTAAGGGIMVDGQRLGPPPDMPSLLLSNRIVYLGMPIAAQVTHGDRVVARCVPGLIAIASWSMIPVVTRPERWSALAGLAFTSAPRLTR